MQNQKFRMSPPSKLIVSATALTLFLISSLAANVNNPSTPVTRGTVCRSTPDPDYCKFVLSPADDNQTNSTTYDYGRFSVRKSLSQSVKFLNLIEKYFKKHRSSLPAPVIGAFEDCLVLVSQNIDYISTSVQGMSSTNETLQSSTAVDDIQTYLSAALTNQATCLDGLRYATADEVDNGIVEPLTNDTKLNSVTLALFNQGWVLNTPRTKPPPPPKKKRLPFPPPDKPPSMSMSAHARSVLESTLSGRKLLQTTADESSSDEEVLIKDIVVVAQDGSGNFTTINEAIAVAPNKTNGAEGYFLIYITAGVYEEYISIPKNTNYLMMVGDGINQTIITGNRSVADGWTTFNSATLAVVAPNFLAIFLTFRNTAGPAKHQAVAVRNGGDLSIFYSCSFEGYQDTLYVHSLRQFYRDCDIYGTVDFIFGNAAAVLQNCNIYPRLPMTGQTNMITAQGRTDPNQNTGISIHNCTVRAAGDLAANGSNVRTYLGRPWKLFSRTVFMVSFMDSLINPAGWGIWSGDFALSTLYYAEYGNTGPGSDTTNRVTWPGYSVLNVTDAVNFTVGNFLMGDYWIPNTGIPYTSGLETTAG